MYEEWWTQLITRISMHSETRGFKRRRGFARGERERELLNSFHRCIFPVVRFILDFCFSANFLSAYCVWGLRSLRTMNDLCIRADVSALATYVVTWLSKICLYILNVPVPLIVNALRNTLWSTTGMKILTAICKLACRCTPCTKRCATAGSAQSKS